MTSFTSPELKQHCVTQGVNLLHRNTRITHDPREDRFFAIATQVTPSRAGLKNGCYLPQYPVLKVSTLLFLFSFSSFCIALLYFQHFLTLVRPPDLKQKVQTRQFACKFNLGHKFGAETLINRRGKRQAK